MDPISEKRSSSWDFLTSNPLFSNAASVISSFQDKRASLNLPNPGTIDRLSKEVESDVFLNNFSFTGLRADITKTFSGANPLFQVSHQLAMGTQSQPPYAFAVMYGSPKIFMQANLDNERSLMARMNYRWNSSLITKVSAQLAPDNGQSVFSLENDYTGSDFTASIKAINPSLLEGGFTGMMTGEYLQSITSRLSLGINALWQRQGMNSGPETMLTYAARYKTQDWIASARFISMGALQTSYWRRIADKVEAGVDLNLSFLPSQGGMMGGGTQAEGLATIGTKYEFRNGSVVRAQVDSHGRIGCLMEKRVAPPVAVTFVGQIDHFKNEAKVGLSISIDAMSEEVMEQQERLAASGEEIPSPPFQ